MNFFLLVVALVALGLVESGNSAAEQCSLPVLRLPQHVRPKHYQLHIEPSLKELEFKGRVQIDLLIEGSERNNAGLGTNGNQILFHADRGITLDERSMRFVLEGDRQVDIANVCRDPEHQLVLVTLAEELPKEQVQARLLVSFHGPLRDDMFGFYKSSYFSEDKQKHYLATTQFEATEARKAFPCFDEPSMKATFQLTIIHEPQFVALSNTEVVEETILEDERRMVKFATTPPMSTYLMAYVVGEFEYIERVILGGRLKVRVYGAPGESHKGEFALDTACRAIQLMEDYFGIEFPLNKMDLIGIPDFDAGAMENWGLMTFRETRLQVDENHSTAHEMAMVGKTVIHELAHQWFGNLVTMRWWDDLWLNEGFATWMGYHILEQVHPQFDVKYIFLQEIRIQALKFDARQDTHAIQPEHAIATNEQISGLFDTITYEKSASILSFIHNDYLGPELFKQSLRHYMAKHKYGNTVTDDLCKSMEEVSKLPVKPILDSWTAQAGYPLLRLDLDKDDSTLDIRQNRFMSNLRMVQKLDLQQKWLIPMSMVVEAPGKRELLKFNVNSNKMIQSVKLPSWFKAGRRGHWLKLNHEYSGFYRVDYPPELFALFKEPIKTGQMSPDDRLNVLEDAKALLAANSFDFEVFVEMHTWFAKESHGAVLRGLLSSLDLMKLYAKQAARASKDFDYLAKMHQFMVNMFEHHLKNPIFTDLTASVDQIDEQGLAEVLKLLVSIDHEPAAQVALRMFAAANGDITKIRVPLREAVYMAVARSGSDEQHAQLIELLTEIRSRSERNRLIIGLAHSKHLHRQRKLASLMKEDFDRLKVDPPYKYIVHLMTENVPNTVAEDFFSTEPLGVAKVDEVKKPSIKKEANICWTEGIINKSLKILSQGA